MKVITANCLKKGAVIYLDKQEAWTHDLSHAKSFADDESADAALKIAQERSHEVADIYLIEVSVGSDGLVEVSGRASLREKIRQMGPTIRTDLGYQAFNARVGE